MGDGGGNRLRDGHRGEATPTFLATFVVVLLTRVPFLAAGYGVDPDAFRVATNAAHIATTHIYTASRRPGYPVQEIACALLYRGGPVALNGATAVMSALGFAFFALTLRRLHAKNPFVTSLAAALVPVVYINSTSAMDYLWALAFLLAALYALVSRRMVIAGVLVGLAIGSRITSSLMLAPFALYLYLDAPGARKTRLFRILQLGVSAGAAGLIFYAPALQRYGLRALVHDPSHPGFLDAAKAASIDTWGVVGVLTLAVAVVFACRNRDPEAKLQPLGPWILAVGLYIALFAWLPIEAGYLVPIIPFVLLLLDALLGRRHLLVVCGGLAVSSFVCGLCGDATPGGPSRSPLAVSFHVHGRAVTLDVLKGPILEDHSARIEGARYVARAREQVDALPAGSLVVVGTWWPQINASFHGEIAQSARYLERFGEKDAAKYGKGKAGTVYYLANQKEHNVDQRGINLDRVGGEELVISDAKQPGNTLVTSFKLESAAAPPQVSPLEPIPSQWW